ncbi:hypothetical protein WJX72_011139 [[Myrmecia] bisecta]|uniref:Uncharacterized protein n=1 Tax=[Myrmecia] bisecta TaxID=41462 RepID=A0AAW1QAX1_9CHLO
MDSSVVQRMLAKAAELEEEAHLLEGQPAFSPSKTLNTSALASLGKTMTRTSSISPSGRPQSAGSPHRPTGSLLHSLSGQQSASAMANTARSSSSRDGTLRRQDSGQSIGSQFRRTSVSSQASMRQTRNRNQDLIEDQLREEIEELQGQVEHWKNKYGAVLEENERRQDSYIRRERKLETAVAELQQKLEDALGAKQKQQEEGPGTFGKKSATIKQLHSQILQGIDVLAENRQGAKNAVDAATLKQMRSRLNELEAQVLADRTTQKTDLAHWEEKTSSLHKELETCQAAAAKLQDRNASAEEAVRKLHEECKSASEERDLLTRQSVMLKRENQRIRDELDATRMELQEWYSATDKHEQAIRALKREVEMERRRARAARAALTTHLAQRTALQQLLKQALAETCQQRLLLQSHSPNKVTARPASARMASLSPAPALAGAGRPTSAAPHRTHLRRPATAQPRARHQPPTASGAGGGNRANGTSQSQDVETDVPPAHVVQQHAALADLRIQDLSAAERQQWVEQLLAREDLIRLLYLHAFPNNPNLRQSGVLESFREQILQRNPWRTDNARPLRLKSPQPWRLDVNTMESAFLSGSPQPVL